MGRNEISDLVLYLHSQTGKPVKMIMMIQNLPGEDGENRLPAVQAWVDDVLSPVMPEPWQADLTEPVIFKTRPLPEIGSIFLFFLSPARVYRNLAIRSPEGSIILWGAN